MGNLLKDVVWLSIFQLLVDILQLMLEDPYFIGVVNKSKKDVQVKASTAKLVTLCSNILLVASSNVKLDRDLKKCLMSKKDLDSLSVEKIENIAKEYEGLETDFFYYLFVCLKNCLSFCPEEIVSFYKSTFVKKGALIALVATHPSKNTVAQVNKGIVELCSLLKSAAPVKPTPAYYLLDLLTRQLENVLSLSSINYEFFDLWDKLIRLIDSQSVDKDALDIKGLTRLLYSTIVNRPIIEDDVKLDPILSGSLLMLDTLDELFKDYIKEVMPEIYSKEFLHFLLDDGLFSRAKPDHDIPEVSYPL